MKNAHFLGYTEPSNWAPRPPATSRYHNFCEKCAAEEFRKLYGDMDLDAVSPFYGLLPSGDFGGGTFKLPILRG